MKITLTHPQPFAFTVHTAGVRVEVEGQGATVPPDQPPPVVVPPPATGFDTNTQAALLEAWPSLDPFGPPAYVALAPLGFEFKWEVPVVGFSRQASCYRWTCGIVPEETGRHEFRVRMKSSGAVVFAGRQVWSDDREPDPGSPAIAEVLFDRELVAGTLAPLQILTRFEGFMAGCLVDWKPPSEADFKPLSQFYCRPPADWQSRLKAYTPPAPAPLPYIIPDAAYRSPDLTLPPHEPIDALEVDPLSDQIIGGLGAIGLHPVFGPAVGIPFQVVDHTTPRVQVVFDAYAAESDPGPYRIPDMPVVEGGGGDKHCIVYDGQEIQELFVIKKVGDVWHADSGAKFDSFGVRVPGWQPGWTSADAAGLPILPYLLRYDEFAAGEINHAIRVSVPKTRRAFVAPATHWAGPGGNVEELPPMGCRLRLKASFDESTMPAELRPVVRAMKRYGIIVADNGGPFIGVCGVPDARWDNDLLAKLKAIKATEFEVTTMPAIVTEVK